MTLSSQPRHENKECLLAGIRGRDCSFRLGCGVLANDALDSLLVLDLVPLEEIVRLSLRGGLGVGVVEEVLDSQEDLLDGDGRLPGFVFIEDREANSAGWVDIRMKQGRDEFALGWLRGILIRESHGEFEQAALPDRFLLAGNSALPVLEVEDAFLGSRGLRIEREGMITTPLLAFLLESVLAQSHGEGVERCDLWPDGSARAMVMMALRGCGRGECDA